MRDKGSGSVTREAIAATLREELSRLNGERVAAGLDNDLLLSQIINSSGFMQLLIAVERKLDVTIDDEDFYEAAPVTVGDLVEFLHAQVRRQEEAP